MLEAYQDHVNRLARTMDVMNGLNDLHKRGAISGEVHGRLVLACVTDSMDDDGAMPPDALQSAEAFIQAAYHVQQRKGQPTKAEKSIGAALFWGAIIGGGLIGLWASLT